VDIDGQGEAKGREEQDWQKAYFATFALFALLPSLSIFKKRSLDNFWQ